ncbi:hypothetical protein D3C81_2077780 [compost metagenome]
MIVMMSALFTHLLLGKDLFKCNRTLDLRLTENMGKAEGDNAREDPGQHPL